MGWVNWNRKSTDSAVMRAPLGVDLNAGRARAANGRAVRNKLFPLDEPQPDLPLAISLEKRTPEVGRAAYAVCRKLPHAICAGYLPMLGQAQEWKGEPNRALRGRGPGPRPRTAAGRAAGSRRGELRAPDLPVAATGWPAPRRSPSGRSSRSAGTATTPLALAAERATHYLYGHEEADESPRPGRSITPTSVLIVDVDDHALTVAVVRMSEEEVRTIGSATFPRLGARLWRDRLLDALADRCVRICRRDPRDTADAEQMLFDQIEESIDRARTGQRVSLTVRSTHWFQDLVLTPADLDGFCVPLCRQAAEEVRHLLASLNEIEPPRAAWLTHDAGRLPGLAAALHQNMTERTNVRVLHPEAAAVAAVEPDRPLVRWANCRERTWTR